MAKFLVLAFFAAVAGVLAELPSNYLPPQGRNSLSSQYGAPGGGLDSSTRGRGSTSFHSQRFGSRSFSYNSEHKTSRVGLSQLQNAGHGSFGASVSSFGPSRSSVANDGRYSRLGVSQQYGVPAQSFSAPSQSSFAPSPAYGSPNQGQAYDNGFGSVAGTQFAVSDSRLSFARQGFSGAVGHRFGASSGGYSNVGQGFSSSGRAFGAAQAFFSPSSQYSPPSSKYGAPFAKRMDDDLSEPANYEYKYQVLAANESGAEFGHHETRQNEAAKGEYRVLLPDGRMQIVQYEADEEGFRPNIRYEETGKYPVARNNERVNFRGPY